MSSRTDHDHLNEILVAVAAIIALLAETKGFDAYMADLKTRSAVERQLQIVTEAVYRLGTDAESRFPGPNWSEWKGMGNILRHAYHRLDHQVIWDTIIDDLPQLQLDVTAALKTLDPPA